jgi:D-alanine-D-alanine ligase
MDLKNLKIGVLGGGVSSERSISLMSAQNVWAALQRKGFHALFIDIVSSDYRTVAALMQSYMLDTAFIALHGAFGEDGGMQQILDDLHIPYTGSDTRASRLAMDKILAKKVFQKANIPTPSFFVHSCPNVLPKITRYPAVIKPNACGSSLGVSIISQESEMAAALREAFKYNDKVLIEEYIAGRELTVGIFDEKPLAIVEIVPKAGYYDFSAKYDDGKTDFIAPAKLSPRIYEQCQQVGLRAHQALGCRHFSRVDLRLSHDELPYVLEVNSIPGLTSHSLLPLSAGAASCGMGFDELIIGMLALALNNVCLSQQWHETKK